jgi:molybdopterin molybdotransferase
LISADEAQAIILKNVGRLGSHRVDIWSAYGRVVDEDVHSDTDLPPFNRAAMDGYAVRSEDVKTAPAALTLCGTVSAGTFSDLPVAAGTCMKIMTGGVVPEGADAVVKVEDTTGPEEGMVEFRRTVSPGENVAKRGEDVRKGEVVLERGSLIRGPEVAVCASVGKTSLEVVEIPSVGVLPTGNEVVDPAELPPYGKIRNSNGPMLFTLVQGAGCRAEYMGIAPDSEDELRAAVRKGFEHDVLLLSGGVSMGEYDLIPDVLEKEGAVILFHRVRVKPGKPLLFARKEGCMIFGVPGNPVSNFTTFFLFIRPALLKLMGRADYLPNRIDAVLGREFTYRSDRELVVPSFYMVTGGIPSFTPSSLNGSADIAGCVGVNSLAMFPEGSHTVARGERVSVLLID